MYRVETPPKSPRAEGIAKESGMSPFLNKMSLKCPREGDEEETEQRMVKMRGEEKAGLGKEPVTKGGRERKG